MSTWGRECTSCGGPTIFRGWFGRHNKPTSEYSYLAPYSWSACPACEKDFDIDIWDDDLYTVHHSPTSPIRWRQVEHLFDNW